VSQSLARIIKHILSARAAIRQPGQEKKKKNKFDAWSHLEDHMVLANGARK